MKIIIVRMITITIMILILMIVDRFLIVMIKIMPVIIITKLPLTL